MEQLGIGVTRTVYRCGRWAVKVPGGQGRRLVRGWLANQSEWRQRHRADVARPWLTLAHVVLVMPVADRAADDTWWEEHARPWLTAAGYSDEESKSSSWGLFGRRWLLVDFDRASDHPRTAAAAVYYWLQERPYRRMARRGN